MNDKNIVNEINKNELESNDERKKENEAINERFLKLELNTEKLGNKIIKSDYEIVKIKYEALETDENFIINSVYLKISKRKIDYLENYIKSLKKIIIDLSNPYNINLWRKIANIILKNFLIILKNNDFTVVQKKTQSIYDDLEKLIKDIKKSSMNVKNKLKNYENDLKEQKKVSTQCSSPAADKKRFFNIITIKKKSEWDIACSLSIEFLFFLKEKGNKFGHFDESVLNYLLFNNLNITEERLMDKKENKINKDRIKSEKTNKIGKITIKNLNEQKKIEEIHNHNQIKDIKSKFNTPKIKEKKIIEREKDKNIKKNKTDGIKSKSIELKKDDNKLNRKIKIKEEISKSIKKKFDYYKLKNIENIENINTTNNKRIINNISLESRSQEQTDKKISDYYMNKIKSKSKEPKKSDKKNNFSKIDIIKPKSMEAKIKGKEFSRNKFEEDKNKTQKEKTTSIKNKEKLNLNEPLNIEKKVNKNNIGKILTKETKDEIKKRNELNHGDLKENDASEKNKEINSNKRTYEKVKKIEVIGNSTNSINININKEYKGKKRFTGKDLIEIFKNPLRFQQKNIKKKDLFDLVYKDIDDIKTNIGYKEDNKRLIDLENKSNDLSNNIEELIKQLEENFEQNKLDISKIKDNKNIAPNLKDKINIYFDLKKFDIKIKYKIKVYNDNKLKLNNLKNSLLNSEKEVEDYINTINEHIQKVSELINLNDIFEEYKIQLKKNIVNKPEYKEYSDIFNDENINKFNIDDLYKCLHIHLKDNEYSISKRDITNYNLFVEVLNNFNELFYMYKDNVDVELKLISNFKRK